MVDQTERLEKRQDRTKSRRDTTAFHPILSLFHSVLQSPSPPLPFGPPFLRTEFSAPLSPTPVHSTGTVHLAPHHLTVHGADCVW